MKTRIKAWATPFFALALTVLVSAPAGAQGFGVSGGLSLSDFSGDDVGDPDSRTGVNVGAFLDFALGDIIFFDPGLYYIQKGAESEGVGDETFALDYLELPLLLRIAISPERTFGFNAYLGPTLAYNLSCEASVGSISVDCDESGADVKNFDFGAAFGAGLSYEMSPGMALLATGIWDLGLTSIDDSGDELDFKNEAILLSVGLLFRR
jgi:hypothetical protein